MKYYLLNKDEIVNDININPKLIKTKSSAKIERYRKLLKQVTKLKSDIVKELRTTNTRMLTDEVISEVLEKDGTEITNTEFNAMYVIPLLDDQVSRINAYNKTKVMHGKLYGSEIRLDGYKQ